MLDQLHYHNGRLSKSQHRLANFKRVTCSKSLFKPCSPTVTCSQVSRHFTKLYNHQNPFCICTAIVQTVNRKSFVHSHARPNAKQGTFLLTGASPGHSYTVKSPSSVSSSDTTPGSGTLGSTLCLFINTNKKNNKVRMSGEKKIELKLKLGKSGFCLTRGKAVYTNYRELYANYTKCNIMTQHYIHNELHFKHNIKRQPLRKHDLNMFRIIIPYNVKKHILFGFLFLKVHYG